MKKGDIVIVKATVRAVRQYLSGNITKVIKRYKIHGTPINGIVLGYSHLKTGKIIKGQYYDEPNELRVEDSHRVIVVEPIEQNNTWWGKPPFATNRYLEPIRCFEEDLELVNG